MARQQQKMKVVAYELRYELDWEPGLGDIDDPDYLDLCRESYRSRIREEGIKFDAEVDETTFPDYSRLESKIWHNPMAEYEIAADIKIPDPIVFNTWFDSIEYLDYPYNHPGYPIMSPQMLETIQSTGDFRYCTYPTLMKDTNILWGTDTVAGRRKSDFLIVQTLEFLDAYDWPKSEYEIDGEDTNFTKVVLKEPIPALFRLVSNETRLYVSAAAKEALEAAGTARGVWFLPIDEEYKMSIWGYGKYL
jgi:hypothetical protein